MRSADIVRATTRISNMGSPRSPRLRQPIADKRCQIRVSRDIKSLSDSGSLHVSGFLRISREIFGLGSSKNHSLRFGKFLPCRFGCICKRANRTRLLRQLDVLRSQGIASASLKVARLEPCGTDRAVSVVVSNMGGKARQKRGQFGRIVLAGRQAAPGCGFDILCLDGCTFEDGEVAACPISRDSGRTGGITPFARRDFLRFKG
ncbi:hypothetical protein HNR26_004979 [Rhizobium rosettiformans]|uniref:Uncharacterized protein n=1 Tax=Rhizobium rosettiformans TaxID=1368430 RepID=A0A7W8HWZ9_9HYPH|nr:hypothetical protein [Rhizobium rosettiformans]MBB5278858.1 hypothetical protein [Rhizobium rosettiformans]